MIAAKKNAAVVTANKINCVAGLGLPLGKLAGTALADADLHRS